MDELACKPFKGETLLLGDNTNSLAYKQHDVCLTFLLAHLMSIVIIMLNYVNNDFRLFNLINGVTENKEKLYFDILLKHV